MLSLGAAIYLIARAAPRVGDVEESFEKETFHAKLDKLIAKIPFEKLDEFFTLSVEKLLRKIKLLLMKCDNLLAIHIKKIKKKEKIGVEDKQKLFVLPEEGKKEE